MPQDILRYQWMLASGSEVSAPYIISVIIGLLRYNVLRSGANHTKCEGNRWANEVSPTDSAPLFLSANTIAPRLGQTDTERGSRG